MAENESALKRAERFQQRTREFGLRVIRLFSALPRTEVARVIGRQLLRSGTSVGANYRAVCRSRSKREFIARMGIVVEEADESIYWIELLTDGGVMAPTRLASLLDEATQLVAICTASLHTARHGRKPRNEDK